MSRVAIQPGATDDRYNVEAIGRAVDVLTVLAAEDRPIPLREIVSRLGWTKPTAYRVLRTLMARGLLREVPGEGYVLGVVLVTIGQAALRAIELPQTARPHLESLHRSLGETVNLTVLDRDEIVYIERVEDKQILGVRLTVGSRLPAYCTSMGHALLAGLPDSEVRRRLGQTAFESRGPRTLGSLDELLDRLRAVRQHGYALNDEELALGHRAAGAPVQDHTGAVVAAVNVSVPAVRVTVTKMKSQIVPQLVATANAISAELGAPDPDDAYNGDYEDV